MEKAEFKHISTFKQLQEARMSISSQVVKKEDELRTKCSYIRNFYNPANIVGLAIRSTNSTIGWVPAALGIIRKLKSRLQ